MDERYRVNLINTSSGVRNAVLIGTANAQGESNLAIFNSITHIGANPPLIGLVFRPLSVDRHTYDNIRETGHYTINQVNKGIYIKAHHTSAKYPQHVSEFGAAQLNEQYVDGHKAPFVMESFLKMGLEYVEEYPIQANGTILLIGKVKHLILPTESLDSQGHILHERISSVGVSGLDGYYKNTFIDILPYARPKED